jgi:pre-rRNA-processing protein TSR4
MVLLLQLNGDLPEFFPGHERRLYVLTCRRKTCRRKQGSVRVLRGVRITKVADKDKRGESIKAASKGDAPPLSSPVNLGETLFGTKPSSSSTSANPFSVNPSSSAATNLFSTPPFSAPNNPFSAAGLPVSELAAKSPQRSLETNEFPKTFASVLSLNADKDNKSLHFGPPPAPEPWPQSSELPSSFPLYYLVDANYEILDKINDPPIPSQTLGLDEDAGGSNQKEDKDVFESTIDKTFQKFADRLAQNPEQVIRYEFKGQPLLYSKHDDVGTLLGSSGRENAKITTISVNGSRIPRCGNCSAGRVFEVQLTPHAIMELEREETSIDGMEWGTIIVGVCERDCQQNGVQDGEAGYVEEWAGVQWEELNERG